MSPPPNASRVPEDPPELARAHRPQFLALLLFGFTIYERPSALSAGSIIDVLGDLGIASHAVRSTLTRMTERGLLTRIKRSREVYYALAAHGSAVLADGRAAALQPPDRSWDGSWTVLAFTLPEDQRDIRHQLRSRLAWSGFGLLRSGMWIAPGRVDVAELVSDLGVAPAIRAFTAKVEYPTDDIQLVNDAFDLEAIAARYRAFIDRWGHPELTDLAAAGPLTRILLLQSEWAQIARADPRLPVAHLPTDWPAKTAYTLYHDLHGSMEPQARAECSARTQIIEVSPEPVA